MGSVPTKNTRAVLFSPSTYRFQLVILRLYLPNRLLSNTTQVYTRMLEYGYTLCACLS
jgi:hypothetical protein